MPICCAVLVLTAVAGAAVTDAAGGGGGDGRGGGGGGGRSNDGNLGKKTCPGRSHEKVGKKKRSCCSEDALLILM